MLEAEVQNCIELKTVSETDKHISSLEYKDVGYENDNLLYHEFFERYLRENKPCIIQVKVAKSWISVNNWVSENKPNLSYISMKYGSAVVPVANCDEKYYNVQKKSETKLCDYLNYWNDYILKNHADLPCLYLKDWHFTRDFPEENIYRVPKYFASDWLNEYYSAKTSIKDDYRFVYMGPKGSWTPLHADVFTSFSWSINICGRKRWLLFPPGEEECLKDRFGQLAYDATVPEMNDEKLFPKYKELNLSIEVIQEAGQAIFVPSGWHHQVWNMEDTISINHNWINGCNIGTMWTSLKDNLRAVKKEVEDCKDMEDWEEHCQLMLQATFGINYEEFYSFLYFIGRRRLDTLKENKPMILYGDWKLGKYHILFDLTQLLKILTNFTEDSDTVNLKFYKNLVDEPEKFIEEIKNCISNETPR